MLKKQRPFYLITFSIMALLVLPGLLQEGMFLDGVLYAAVARNLAEGLGDFWHLHYTQTADNVFYGHPPLVFGLQALFFKIFGDHLFVERLYSLFTFILTAFAIHLAWKEIFYDKKEYRTISWLPLLLWAITPLVFWSYSNNMLENTVSVFTISAVYLLIKWIRSPGYRLIMLSGMLIFFGMLSKGPVALFPLAFLPLCFFILKISLQRAALHTVLLAAVPVMLSAGLFFIPEAKESLFNYFDLQVVRSIKGELELSEDRFYIIERLFSELIFAGIFCLLIYLLARIKKERPVTDKSLKSWSALMLLTGLSASLPILISPKQMGFYLVPSMPYLALGFAILTAPAMLLLINRINPNAIFLKRFTRTSAVVFAASILLPFAFINKMSRDKMLIADVKTIGKVIPHDNVISASPQLSNNWRLYAYLARFYNISLDIQNQHEYFLTVKDAEAPADEYKLVDVPASDFMLWKKNE